jgi:hypothetical protein
MYFFLKLLDGNLAKMITLINGKKIATRQSMKYQISEMFAILKSDAKLQPVCSNLQRRAQKSRSCCFSRFSVNSDSFSAARVYCVLFASLSEKGDWKYESSSLNSHLCRSGAFTPGLSGEHIFLVEIGNPKFE